MGGGLSSPLQMLSLMSSSPPSFCSGDRDLVLLLLALRLSPNRAQPPKALPRTHLSPVPARHTPSSHHSPSSSLIPAATPSLLHRTACLQPARSLTALCTCLATSITLASARPACVTAASARLVYLGKIWTAQRCNAFPSRALSLFTPGHSYSTYTAFPSRLLSPPSAQGAPPPRHSSPLCHRRRPGPSVAQSSPPLPPGLRPRPQSKRLASPSHPPHYRSSLAAVLALWCASGRSLSQGSPG